MFQGTELLEALSQVFKKTVRMSKQRAPSHQRDHCRVEFLRNAVVAYNWERKPPSRTVPHSLTFHQLYQKLQFVVQLNNEAKTEALKEKSIISGMKMEDRSLDINNTGQARIRHPNEQNPKKSQNYKFFMDIQVYFNCDGSDRLA